MRGDRYPGLDTLRSIAILMVMPFHLWQALSEKFVGASVKAVVKHGWAGVDLFFVLSGFLIASQLFVALKRDGKVNFRQFYFKRALRILPSFYLVTLLYYAWPAFREKPDLGPSGSYVFFWMNYRDHFNAFSHAWSLCVEEHFYLLFPGVVALVAARPRVFRPAFLLPVALLAEPLARYYLWTTATPFWPYIYRRSHTHFDGLLVGIGLALIRHARPQWWQWLTARPWSALILGMILAGGGMALYADLNNALSYIFSLALVGYGFGFVLIAAMAPGFWLARRRIPGAETAATLAYSLYLIHKQMIHLATTLVGDFMDQKAMTVGLATALTFGFALALHHGVEKPALAFRNAYLAAAPSSRLFNIGRRQLDE